MRYIDQEKIYEQTNYGMMVFVHFFGEEVRNPKHFFKIRESEKTASAKISWHQGLARITDFGNRQEINGLPAIPFAMKHLNLEFYDAMRYIEEEVIGNKTDGESFKATKWGAEYDRREVKEGEKDGDYNFTFKEKPEKHDLEIIGRYVTEDTLKKFNGKAVKEYAYVGTDKKNNKPIVHIFKSTPTYPMFLFDFGDFKKLYKPLEKEKKYRFVFIGEKPKDFVFGLQQILEAENEFTASEEEESEEPVKPPENKPNAIVRELFRCSGESDALNLASLGYHVYWIGSETVKLTYQQFKEIDDLCEKHHQIMDLDQTGKEQALKNALQFPNLYNIEIPGWIEKISDWRGNKGKDLKDYINLAGENYEQTQFQFSVTKAAARRAKFWEKIVEPKKTGPPKVTYNINMEFFYFFLKAQGFYQMESIYHKKAGYCYVHIRNKEVELIHPDNIKRIIKRFVKDWIQKNHIRDSIKILNKINTSAQITESNLETIQDVKLEFRNHSQNNEYVHFKNGNLHVTPDQIKFIKNEEVPNFILDKLEVNKNIISHVCDHKIRAISKPPIEVNPSKSYKNLLDELKNAKKPEEREAANAKISQLEDIDRYEVTINDEEFLFVRFLKDLARIHWRKELERKETLTEHEKKEQKLVLANLLFVIGYHCQQYKDPNKPWITFLQDMKISEVGEASGRSGKSLLSKAPTFVRASFYKGGRSLTDRNAYQFFYDGFTEFHDYIEVDDLAEYADINWFYSQITGNREINPKNYAPFTLSYKDSGKILISSNYELPNVNSSTIARMLNAGVSDYYHEATRYNDYKETRTPFGKFGRLLYDDFTEDEWNKFYNLAAYCIQLVMRFHKIQPPLGNLQKRQARRVMTQGLGKDEIFFQWANTYFQIYPTDQDALKPEVSPHDIGYFNTYIIKEAAYDEFQKNLTSKQKSDYRINKFKKHIEAFCEYYGYAFNPEGINGRREDGRIMKTIDGNTRECFYISTKISENGSPINKQEAITETKDEDPPF